MKEEKLSFVSFDGETIHLLKLIPDNAAPEKTPAVLFEPGNRCTPDDYRWLIEPLCNAGFLVYGIYQRGYGSAAPDVNDRGGFIQQHDMKLALSSLKEDPLTDIDRVACVGHSNGGHMVMRLATEETFKCGVAMSQISDWGLFVSSSRQYLPDYYEQVIEEFAGSPEDNPAPYVERSCLHLADKVRIPTLSLVGGDDTTTPPHLTRLMVEALRKNGQQADMVVVPGVGHFYEVYAFNGYLTDEVAKHVCDYLEKML